MYQQKCKVYQQEHYCQFWQNLVDHASNGKRYKFFTLKIEIGKKCINSSLKGTNKNTIAKVDKIWLHMFRMGRDTNFG